MNETHISETDIAIVGMSGRFPGADDVDELWRRVAAGDDCLVDLDAAELIAQGVPSAIVRDPDRVLRDGRLADVAGFDREFFGIGARDASIMDPQHRHFLECSWEALESAAITPEGFEGAIGVFAGCGMNTYLLENLLTNPDLLDDLGWFLLRHTGNDKDFLATGLSYRLGLRGPSVNVQTACSTSLVAVHLGVQSLLSFESDLVLAGGVTIEFPHATGYTYRDGEILSASGRCRAFDAGSDGTVLTGGVAVVALRRLSDAIDDGDPVLAIVKGSAVNNDGERKVGFLAPSVDGHADVVREAVTVADVDVETIGLLEAHGTGTAVGDPIEVAALTEAFRSGTDATGFCRLSSTKPNIGHLDTAAGGASLIKAVQALRHRTLPPLANFTGPSPLIDLDRSPFTVSGSASEWPAGVTPRRAGVSSLGVGGTNAHVVIEEAPEPPTAPPGRPGQPLLLSGRTRAAVDDAAERLALFFERNPDTDLADVAHTLLAGRRHMPVRRVVAVTDAATAPAELRDDDRRRRHVAEIPDTAPPVVFTFPGGGAQYVGMANDLDDRFDEFHRVRSEGIALVRACGGVDLEALLAPDASPDDLQRPTASLPAVFVTSVALARQWMAFGVTPDAMIGHSLGEYVAAHLAGVMSYEDAAMLVVARSALMERASGDDAAMLVVPLGVDEVTADLPPELSLATVNADDECVVAGRLPAVDAYAATLNARGVEAARIPLAAAAHSSLLDPVLDEFDKAVRAVTLQPPRIPYVSNLTGDWVTAEQVTDPQYWVDHLRGTVRFTDGLRTVLGPEGGVVVELGPGGSLSSYARRTGLATGTIPVLRHPDDEITDTNHAISAIARLWTFGVDVDLAPFIGPDRRRLRLPTYPFQHEQCWIEPGSGRTVAPVGAPTRPNRISDVDDMTWRPAWRAAALEPSGATVPHSWLVVGSARADSVADELAARGMSVTRSERYGGLPDGVGGVVLTSESGFDAHQDVWLDQARRAAVDLGALDHSRLVALTERAWNVDAVAAEPAGALAAGVVLVAPREYADLTAAQVDHDDATDIAQIVDDVLAGTGVVALRNGERLVPTIVHEPVVDGSDGFRQGGTYIVTGGLGGVGALIAEHLATEHDAALVVVTASELPADADRYLAAHAEDDPTSRRLTRLARLRAVARSVEVVAADLDDAASIDRLLAEADRFGPIDGVVHAAGRLDDQLLDLADTDTMRSVVSPKAAAARLLADRLAHRGTDLLVLVSSTSTWLAPTGQAAYVGANAVLDALAGRYPSGLRVVTVNFGMWAATGMAAEAAVRRHAGTGDPAPMSHPVLAEALTRPDGSITCWGRLSTERQWLVDDHRAADGTPIVPGTGHLDLMISALRRAGVDEPALDDVMLLQPLIVADGTSVQVRVVLGAAGVPSRSVRVDASIDSGAWITCSEATVGQRADATAPVSAGPADRAIDPMSAGRAHLHLGSRWQLGLDARRGDAVALGSIDTDGIISEELDAWSAHPAVVDLATGWAIALDDSDHGSELHVPVGYDRVSWWATVPSHPHVVAVRHSRVGAEFLQADVALFDGERPCLRIEGIQLRAIDGSRLGTAAPALGGGRSDAAPADLLHLATEIGLRPEETLPLFERVVASGASRMVISSVDLDELALFSEPADTQSDGEAGRPAIAGTVEDRVTGLWRSVLGVEEIGPDDDFFDLGGHSLIAIRLLNQLKDEFGVRLQLSAMFEASTVSAMSQVIRSHGVADTVGADDDAASPSTTPHIVPISRSGDRRPFFVVHGAGGSVLFLWTLARALGAERPLFGFQAEGVNEGELPDSSVESMAARYVDELRRHSSGPYLIGGYSGGGIVALEMARQLQQAGEEVDHVVLFDSVPQGTAEVSNLTGWLRLIRSGWRHGWRAVRPCARQRILGSLRRYVPERPERKLEREQQERALGFETADADVVNLYHYFSAAADRYTMPTFDVDVTVVKADLQWPRQPDDYHWSDRITGRLRLVTSPGDHHSMFFPEFAPALADRVRATLDPLDEVDE